MGPAYNGWAGSQRKGFMRHKCLLSLYSIENEVVCLSSIKKEIRIKKKKGKSSLFFTL